MTQVTVQSRDWEAAEYRAPNYFARTMGWTGALLLLSFAGGWFFLQAYGAEDILRLVVQSVVVTVGAVLPLSMYAFFAQTRHAVIWREFAQNLQRLGMKPGHYRERFESVYAGGTTRAARAGGPPGGTLMTIVLFVGWWLVFWPRPQAASQVAAIPFLELNESWLTFGFLGAYIYTLLVFFRRFVTDDLKPNVFVATTKRVIVMIGVVWALAQVQWLVDALDRVNLGEVVAFFIGMYPDVGILGIESLARQVLRTGFKTRYPLSQIRGLTRLDYDRLKEENIDNVQHLATADIVDLLLKTRYPPERIVDWIDQALLQVHLLPRPKNEAGKPQPAPEATSSTGPQPAPEAASPATPQPAPEGTGEESPAPPSTAGESGTQDPARRLEELRAGIEELQGLDTTDPISPFVAAGIRNATDLLYVCELVPADGRQALQALVQQTNPGLDLDLLVAAMQEDPNIVHIRHWREHESLAIAETVDRMLSRGDALMDEATKLEQRGNRDRALELYTDAAEAYHDARLEHNASPVRLSAMLGHGRAMVKLGKYADAIQDFDAVVEADREGGLEARLERTRLYVATLGAPELQVESAGNPIEDVEMLLQHPDYRTAEVWQMDYKVLREATIDTRTARESLAEAIRAAKTNSEKAELLRLRAPYLAPADREADYKRALELVPGDPQAHQALADFYVEQRDYAAAVRTLEQWIQYLEGTDVNERSRWIGRAYEKLGIAHERSGDLQAAVSAFKVAYRMPFDLASEFQPADAQGRLIGCYEKLQAYDDLAAYYQEISDHVSAARVYRRLGDLAGARDQLRQEAEILEQPHSEELAWRLRFRWRGPQETSYYLELALVDACSQQFEQATTNLVTALRQAEGLIDQNKLMSEVESEAALCEGTAGWVQRSRKAWEAIDETLRQAAELWASGEPEAATQVCQDGLAAPDGDQLPGPWRALRESLCQTRLDNWAGSP